MFTVRPLTTDSSLLARIASGIAVLLLVALFTICVVLFSPASTTSLANLFLSGDEVKISCLEYDYTWPDTLTVSKVCVSHPSADLVATNARFNYSDHTLLITALDIKLSSGQASGPEEAHDFAVPAIPASLPTLDIQRVTLSHESLPQALAFSLQQHGKQAFTFENQWQGEIAFTDRGLRGSLVFSLTDVLPFMPVKYRGYLQDTPASPVQLSFNLEPNTVEFSLMPPRLATVRYPVNDDVCEANLTTQGRINGFISVQDNAIRLRPEDVLIILPTPGCLTVGMPDFLQLPETLFIEPAGDAVFTHGQLATTNLHIYSQHQDWDVSLQCLQGKIDGNLEGKVLVDLSLPDALNLHTLARVQMTADGLTLDAKELAFDADDIDISGVRVGALNGVGMLHYHAVTGLKTKGRFSMASLSSGSAIASGLSVDFSLEGKTVNTATGTLDLDVKNVNLNEVVELEEMVQKIAFTPSEQDGGFSVAGETAVVNVIAKEQALGGLTADHKVFFDTTNNALAGTHQLQLADSLQASFDSTETYIGITVPKQDFVSLQPLTDPLLPDMTNQRGTLQLDGQYDIASGELSGNILIEEIAAEYGEYRFSGAQSAFTFSVDSVGLHVPESTFTVDSVDVGMPITDIYGEFRLENGVPVIATTRADMLGGELKMGPLSLSEHKQTLSLAIRDIDLSRVLALQQQAGVQSGGIRITGSVQGEFPVTLENWQPSVTDAILRNQGTGTLKISDNEAFDALKQSQPDIGQQLAMLENLRFTVLQGKLNLEKDGQAFLDIKLEGVNPDYQQPVAFNYTHDQNVFLLLRSLRLGDQISDKVKNKFLNKEPE